MGDKSFLGLVVKEKYAERFVQNPPEERKVLELRSLPVRFLTDGDRFCLLGSSHSSSRRILAVLEFKHCIRLKVCELPRYRDLHRVTDSEIASMGWAQDSQLYGWKVSLVKAFDPPFFLHQCKGEVWSWFPESLVTYTIEKPPALQKRKSESSATDDPPPKSSKTTSTASLTVTTDSDAEEENCVQGDEQIQRCPDNCWMCLLVTEKEWNYLRSSGEGGKFLLRPYGSSAQDLCVLVEMELGVNLVGVISVAKAERAVMSHDSTRRALVLYDSRQVKQLQGHTSRWRLEVLRVDPFDNPILTGCMELPPRSRTRPFAVPIEKLKARKSALLTPFPATHHLQETAGYFMHCVGPTVSDQIKGLLTSLCGENCTIRVGTTCSGTDVCVAVIKQTLDFLQSHFKLQGVTVQHVFSCEKDPTKRALILKDHKPIHCFDDTDVFAKGEGFCYVQGKTVQINKATCAIDVLLSGPVCKDISPLNARRADAANCYQQARDQEETGVSGHTYETGYRKARGFHLFLGFL